MRFPQHFKISFQMKPFPLGGWFDVHSVNAFNRWSTSCPPSAEGLPSLHPARLWWRWWPTPRSLCPPGRCRPASPGPPNGWGWPDSGRRDYGRKTAPNYRQGVRGRNMATDCILYINEMVQGELLHLNREQVSNQEAKYCWNDCFQVSLLVNKWLKFVQKYIRKT